ncbi:Uncharacterised protein [Mycobacteroides abscessus subsp. abscessus]|nr:Uncharacterised protein [Mycobacteroides abscessus subsp. abscessus]
MRVTRVRTTTVLDALKMVLADANGTPGQYRAEEVAVFFNDGETK